MNAAEPLQVLVVGDDAAQVRQRDAALGAAGHEVRACSEPVEALRLLEDQPFDAVLLEQALPNVTGIELLRAIHQRKPELPVALMTSQASVESALEAIRAGACDYLQKPITDPRRAVLALERGATSRRSPASPAPGTSASVVEGMVATSPKMRAVVAESKKLKFGIELDKALPNGVKTDGRRLQQVLKNLLSNAFKFTERGGVMLIMRRASEGWSPDQEILSRADQVVAFAVKDTGIGIAKDKQQIIFEAFQQADGTTSRKYGGTGLGLSISREIARMLGGEIRVQSELGQGSTFTLFLPVTYVAPPRRKEATLPAAAATPAAARPEALEPAARAPAPLPPEEEAGIEDDRYTVQPADRVLLVIEDDPSFARILQDLAHEHGFKVLAATTAARALAFLQDSKVDAVTLDLKLPDRDGWTVLDRIKHNPKTRHLPVHIISVEEDDHRGLQLGAVAHLTKPASKESLEEAFGRIQDLVERPVKNLLVAEDDDAQRKSIVELIGNHDVHTTAVATGQQVLDALTKEHFDCMVLDLGLPDMPGFEVLEKLRASSLQVPPVIVYTGKELSKQEETQLRQVAEAVVIKSVKSPERLLDETALFLHRVESKLPEPKRKMLSEVSRRDPALAGHKVLVVDDDVRNIFALTNVLERQGVTALYAENGKDALAALKSAPDIEAVLMDVMMPEMDGYETMQQIRKLPQLAKLPIIALTAKAMKGDRERCIEAGASDYIAKPVDVEQLLSLLRVWLYR